MDSSKSEMTFLRISGLIISLQGLGDSFAGQLADKLKRKY